MSSPSAKNEGSPGGNTWLKILLATGVFLGCYMAYRGFSTSKSAESVVETKREEPSGEATSEKQDAQETEPEEDEDSDPEAESDNPEELDMNEVGGNGDEAQGSDGDGDVDVDDEDGEDDDADDVED